MNVAKKGMNHQTIDLISTHMRLDRCRFHRCLLPVDFHAFDHFAPGLISSNVRDTTCLRCCFYFCIHFCTSQSNINEFDLSSRSLPWYAMLELSTTCFLPFDHLGDAVENGIFFEGWYFKFAFQGYENTFVVIPGVHMNDDNRHAFIMVAYENTSHYYRFPFEAFSSSTEEFIVKIDNEKNLFTYDKLHVDLKPGEGDDAYESFRFNLTLSSHVSIPDLSVFAPGTMGPFSWIPTMQCNHHVLSMNYDVQGSLQINNDPPISVSGTGYIEKDWGHSFPSSWIWGQANEWENLPSKSSASLFFSFAMIPWYFNLQFPGFLIIFELNGQFYRFNSYLQSSVHNLFVDKATHQISFDVYDVLFQYKLHVNTHFKTNEQIRGALLHGPRDDRMVKFVEEILMKNIFFDVRLSKLIENNSSSVNTDHSDPFIQHGYTEEILFEQRARDVAIEITNVDGLREQFQSTYGHTYPWKFSIIRTIISTLKFIIQ